MHVNSFIQLPVIGTCACVCTCDLEKTSLAVQRLNRCIAVQ